MMQGSITEQVLQRVVKKLTTAGLSNVARSRTAAIGPDEGESTVVRFSGEEAPQYWAKNMVDRRMRIEVISSARGDVPDALLDERRQIVLKTLMADRTLGGLVTTISESSTQMSFEDGQPPIGELIMNFEIRYIAPFSLLSQSI